jgi:hypothetical protein
MLEVVVKIRELRLLATIGQLLKIGRNPPGIIGVFALIAPTR